MKINWESNESNLLLDHQLNQDPFKELLLKDLPEIKSSIWICSSGTSSLSSFRIFNINKEAFLISAQAVCSHLLCNPKDIWLNPLPIFHVGGLSIEARSFVGKFKFIDKVLTPWSAKKFVEDIISLKATLTSMVPAQVFDLVIQGIASPKTLRAALVGGGSLSHAVYKKARALGWPLLPTYGLTECASQIATATLNNLSENKVDLKILDHISVMLSSEGFLKIKSDALFNGFFEIKKESKEYYKRESEYFLTEDFAKLSGNQLVLLGRAQNSRKVKGHLVYLDLLKCLIQEIQLELNINEEIELIFLSHIRKGNEVALVSTHLSSAKKVSKVFNQRVKGHERICLIYLVKRMPHSSIGKFLPSVQLEILNGQARGPVFL